MLNEITQAFEGRPLSSEKRCTWLKRCRPTFESLWFHSTLFFTFFLSTRGFSLFSKLSKLKNAAVRELFCLLRQLMQYIIKKTQIMHVQTDFGVYLIQIYSYENEKTYNWSRNTVHEQFSGFSHPSIKITSRHRNFGQFWSLRSRRTVETHVAILAVSFYFAHNRTWIQVLRNEVLPGRFGAQQSIVRSGRINFPQRKSETVPAVSSIVISSKRDDANFDKPLVDSQHEERAPGNLQSQIII